MLVAIHRPLGIMILILAAIRYVNRMCTKLPPFEPLRRRRWGCAPARPALHVSTLLLAASPNALLRYWS